jgi:uncharacterized protein with beta-barrel porin domain
MTNNNNLFKLGNSENWGGGGYLGYPLKNCGDFCRSAAKKLLKSLKCSLVAASLACAVFSAADVDAQDRQTYREIKNTDGNTVFRLDLYGSGQKWNHYGDVGARDFYDDEIQAQVNALEYWVEIIKPTGTVVTPVVIRAGVDTATDYNAWSAAIANASGTYSYNVLGLDVDQPLYSSGVAGDEVPGYHALHGFHNTWRGFEPPTQLREAVRSMEATAIHEFGHSLGVSGDTPTWAAQLSGSAGSLVFEGTNAATVYGDGAVRAVPMMHGSVGQEDSHFGLQNGLMTHMLFRNYSGFMEAEMAALQDLGYTIDRRNFFGRSVYTDGNTIDNSNGFYKSNGLDDTGNWLGYETGTANTSSHGLGLHIYGSNNTVTQKADLLSVGRAGGGIRVDGFNNKVIVDENVKVYANGEAGTGLLVAFGTDHTIVHRGDIQATGEGVWDYGPAFGVRFDFGPGYTTDTHPYYTVGAPESYGVYSDEYFIQHQLDGALVNRFDVTGSIAGTDAAIYIGDSAHVEEINLMSGAKITGDIISDYDSRGTSTTRSTLLTFGKAADASGEATATADSDFDFTIEGAILGDKNASGKVWLQPGYSKGKGMIDIELVGGKTTVGENADVYVNDFTMDADTTLALENDVNVAGDFTMTDATIGFNTSIDPTINVTGDAGLSGTNTLDLTQFANGNYTVIDAASLTNKTQFDTVTVGGQAKRDRHMVNWDSTAAGNGDIIVQLSAQNIFSTWKGGNGDWDAGTENWRDATTNQGEVFIGGDSVAFDSGEGTINVAAVVNPADMTFTNSVKYAFAGESIHVSKGTSSISAATGTLNIINNAEARFAQNVSSTNLEVNNALMGITKDVTVSGDAKFTDARLEVTTNDNTSAKIGVTGKATVDDGTVDFVGTQRRGIKYTFLTAGNLDVVDEFELGTLSSGYDGALGYAAGANGTYWLQMSENAVDFLPVSRTYNQRWLGGYLDTISPHVPFGDLNDVLGVLDDIVLNNPAAARFALDQMSGSIYGTHATASVMNVGIVNSTLANLLRQGQSQMDKNCNPCDLVTDCDPCEPCAEACDPCEPICDTKSYKRHLWGLGYGTGGASQFDGNTYGYKQSFGGVIIGTDREYKRGTRLGGYFSYGEGRISSVLLDRSESQELLAGIYFRKNLYNGYVLANAGLGNTQYDTQRTISFVNRQAKNKHDAFVGTFYAERGLDFATRLGQLQPYLGIQYIGNRQERFTETGAGSLNLVAKRTETDSFRSLLGTRLQSHVRRYHGGRLNTNANVAWLHEFADTSTSFTAGLAGSPLPATNFTVRGNDTQRDWVILGVGLNYEKNRIRLFGGYDTYCNNQQVLHTGNAGFVYSW